MAHKESSPYGTKSPTGTTPVQIPQNVCESGSSNDTHDLFSRLIKCCLLCCRANVAVQDDWFPFFACIEDAASKGVQPDQVEGVTHGCAVHAGLVPSKLMDCYKGKQTDQQRGAHMLYRTVAHVRRWHMWHMCACILTGHCCVGHAGLVQEDFNGPAGLLAAQQLYCYCYYHCHMARMDLTPL
jgi:hypothetical protein